MITAATHSSCSAGALAAAKFSAPALAQEIALDTDRHGLSAFGDLQYPADFPHFAYVNPNAPERRACFPNAVSSRTLSTARS